MQTIRTFGLSKIDVLISEFESELARVQRDQGEEPVHKLRVSIRRLQQGLRVFHQFVDAEAAKEIRGEMRKIMKLAGAVRERDIGIQLLAKANLPHDSVQEERSVTGRRLEKAVRKLSKDDWRSRLGVDTQ